VTDYQWEDHHSPPLSLLFKACVEMHEFLLKDEQNVVIVHCNAGKGRTGTLISSYLLFCGFA
jgi:phosphatidylinositol-3,4,5-trisphosphate 3-phosphatase/dual-specificity protein phosphatase PTEN